MIGLALIGLAVTVEPAAPPAPAPADGPEVVVRARPRDELGYRIRPIAGADRFERKRRDGFPPAAIAAFSGIVSAEGESAALAGGQISKRAMVRFTKPF